MPKIISVPHSGSRSLIKHVNGGEYRVGRLYHFGDHDSYIKEWDGKVAIPLRNPIDTVTSWRVRNRPLKDLARRYHLLLDYVNLHVKEIGKGKRIRLYKVEDLPYRVGEKPESRLVSPRLSIKFVKELLSDEIKEFYRKHGGYDL